MKPKFVDQTGNKFGSLFVRGLHPEHLKYPQKYICLCECGNEDTISAFDLTSGKRVRCRRCSIKKGQKASDEQIVSAYAELNNVWRVAEMFNMCGQSVQERLAKLGIQRNNIPFSDTEWTIVKEKYNEYLLQGRLQELADSLGRTKQFLCRQAGKLGLTDLKRKKSLLANFVPSIKPGHWDTHPHPKGMLGKNHSIETLDRLSIINKANQAKISADPDKRADINKRTLMTRFSKGKYSHPRPETTWKAAWREIGGKRKYFRSRWEANYARYLEFLKVHGEIKEWEHESEVFWFEGIKRGCMSYLPDFKVTNNDDSTYFVEVKGWMDDRSKTKINRMRIYHPNVKLLLIQGKWFKDNGRKLKGLIQEWE